MHSFAFLTSVASILSFGLVCSAQGLQVTLHSQKLASPTFLKSALNRLPARLQGIAAFQERNMSSSSTAQKQVPPGNERFNHPKDLDTESPDEMNNVVKKEVNSGDAGTRPRAALRARNSVRLFQYQASTPEGESSDFWTRERLHFLRELLAELVGTFMIVQLGTGAVMSAVFKGALVGLFQIAAVWIIAVTMAICTTASISGAHLNPAISLAFVILRPSKSFGWLKLPFYWVAQLCGAVLGSWVNLMMYASVISEYEAAQGIVRSSANAIGSAKAFGEYYLPPVTTAQAFLAESFGTFVLAGVIFALTHPANDTTKNNVYIPPLIGMTVGGLISVLAPLTQAGFNPARDFGPRLVAYAAGWTQVAFKQCWLYIVAPLVGAPLGGFLIDKVLYAGEKEQAHTAATTHE